MSVVFGAHLRDSLIRGLLLNSPLLLGTWSFAQSGVDQALPGLLSGGDPLDACMSVCEVAERDEHVDSVGFGGLPDASGTVSLDACVMRSPSECGSVCCVTRHLEVTRLARHVMEGMHPTHPCAPSIPAQEEGAGSFMARRAGPARRLQPTMRDDGRAMTPSAFWRSAWMGVSPGPAPPVEPHSSSRVAWVIHRSSVTDSTLNRGLEWLSAPGRVSWSWVHAGHSRWSKHSVRARVPRKPQVWFLRESTDFFRLKSIISSGSS